MYAGLLVLTDALEVSLHALITTVGATLSFRIPSNSHFLGHQYYYITPPVGKASTCNSRKNNNNQQTLVLYQKWAVGIICQIKMYWELYIRRLQ
jgi:hypothetical protein